MNRIVIPISLAAGGLLAHRLGYSATWIIAGAGLLATLTPNIPALRRLQANTAHLVPTDEPARGKVLATPRPRRHPERMTRAASLQDADEIRRLSEQFAPSARWGQNADLFTREFSGSSTMTTTSSRSHQARMLVSADTCSPTRAQQLTPCATTGSLGPGRSVTRRSDNSPDHRLKRDPAHTEQA